MSDEPMQTGGPDAADTRTHVERLNPGDNPAAIPGQGVWREVASMWGGAGHPTSHAPGQTPPGHIPLTQETKMADDPLRAQALTMAIAAGGAADEVVGRAQAFYAFLKGENDIPVKLVEGPTGPPGPMGEQGLVGPTGPTGANGKDGRDGADARDVSADLTGLRDSVTALSTRITDLEALRLPPAQPAPVFAASTVES